jgi:hypothetical protein
VLGGLVGSSEGAACCGGFAGEGGALDAVCPVADVDADAAALHGKVLRCGCHDLVDSSSLPGVVDKIDVSFIEWGMIY